MRSTNVHDAVEFCKGAIYGHCLPARTFNPRHGSTKLFFTKVVSLRDFQMPG